MFCQILNHNYSRIFDPTSEVKKLLQVKHKRWNHFKKAFEFDDLNFMDGEGRVFTGLVPYIQSQVDLTVQADYRQYPTVEFREPQLQIQARPYQIDYILAALKKTRMIINATTGAGKTFMMAALMDIIGLDALVLVPNKTLEAQVKNELEKILPPVRPYAYQIGIPRNFHKWATHDLQAFPVLIADECHSYAASQAMEVILNQDAPFRFGFTGTPTGRSDGRDLDVQGLFGEIVKLIEPAALVEQGYIAPTQVDLYHASWDGDFPLMEKVFIVENEKRNNLIVEIVNQFKKQAILILVRRIDHGERLQKAIPGSVFVQGNASGEERERVREDVKAGRTRILIASNVFAAGLDIPNLGVGINAGGGKAEILTGQKSGRLMRPWEGTCKKWIDFADCYHPTMEQHSKERYRIYKNTGLPVDFINFTPAKQATWENANTKD